MDTSVHWRNISKNTSCRYWHWIIRRLIIDEEKKTAVQQRNVHIMHRHLNLIKNWMFDWIKATPRSQKFLSLEIKTTNKLIHAINYSTPSMKWSKNLLIGCASFLLNCLISFFAWTADVGKKISTTTFLAIFYSNLIYFKTSWRMLSCKFVIYRDNFKWKWNWFHNCRKKSKSLKNISINCNETEQSSCYEKVRIEHWKSWNKA